MPHFGRSIRPVLLVTLVSLLVFPWAALPGYAQDSQPQPVTIQGTPELEKLLGAIRDAYVAAHADASIEIDPRGGLRSGFEALCKGEVDVVMSTEPISDDDIQACSTNGQNFIEAVLAYEAVAILPTPESELVCTTADTMNNAWQLGSPAEVKWLDLGSTTLETAVAFYGPDDLNPAYLLFKSLVPAGDLREDIVTGEDLSQIVTKVQEAGSNALGFVSLADLERLDPDGALTPLGIQDADGNCISPSLGTLAARTYPYSRTDYLYINAASAERSDVRAFVQFALVDEGGVKTASADQSYTLADDSTYEYSVNNLVNGKAGRTFSRPVSPVTVSTAEVGTVTITGTSALKDVTDPIVSEFKTRFSGAAVTVNTTSNTQGWEAFCKGEADVIQSTRPATDEEKALCDENGINPYSISLGQQALVLAVPASADWFECATGDVIGKLLRDSTEEAPAPLKWNEINAEWPDTDILLVLPPLSGGETDYLTFTLVGDLKFAVRDDVTNSSDPLYRAQGVANTNNGFTFLWWNEFQKSTAEVKLLSVDGGEGCVAPSAETFADGTYPLSYPVSYTFSQKSFSNPLVRALLWHFFDATSLDTFAAQEYSGLDVIALADTMRDDVYTLLADYELQAAATAEPTAEPTAEATAEATAEPTAEATAEPTAEPTAEATTEPTAEPTAEPTKSN